jgi:phosphohistidine phosphatase
MVEHVRSEAIRPEFVLCSSARRARDTLEKLRPAFGRDVEVVVTDDLYGADSESLLRRLGNVDPGIVSVMLVGHNPGLHDLALVLVGDGTAAATAQLRVKFPTGALATLHLSDATWDHLAPGEAYLASLVTPSQLP